MPLSTFILSNRPFKFGQHERDGRHIGSCLRGYSHGIEPDRHPRLMDHLQAKGLSIKLTGVGLLDIGDEPTDFIGVRTQLWRDS